MKTFVCLILVAFPALAQTPPTLELTRVRVVSSKLQMGGDLGAGLFGYNVEAESAMVHYEIFCVGKIQERYTPLTTAYYCKAPTPGEYLALVFDDGAVHLLKPDVKLPLPTKVSQQLMRKITASIYLIDKTKLLSTSP